MHPDQESTTQPTYVPCQGIKPATFQLQDDTPTNWAPAPARALFYFYGYTELFDDKYS